MVHPGTVRRVSIGSGEFNSRPIQVSPKMVSSNPGTRFSTIAPEWLKLANYVWRPALPDGFVRRRVGQGFGFVQPDKDMLRGLLGTNLAPPLLPDDDHPNRFPAGHLDTHTVRSPAETIWSEVFPALQACAAAPRVFRAIADICLLLSEISPAVQTCASAWLVPVNNLSDVHRPSDAFTPSWFTPAP